MSLTFRKDTVRICWTDGEYANRAPNVEDHPGKVFAVIGPFDGHTDKAVLQDALVMILRGYNVTSDPE